MKKILLPVLCIALFTACNSEQKKEPTHEEEHASSPHSNDTQFEGYNETLSLSPFTIRFEGNDIFKMNDAGEIVSDGTNFGKISDKGIVYDEDSEVRIKLNAQNWLVDEGLNKKVQISEDGSFTLDDDKFAWSGGNFTKNGESTGMTIAPADTKSKLEASILLYLYSSSNISADGEDIEMDVDTTID